MNGYGFPDVVASVTVCASRGCHASPGLRVKKLAATAMQCESHFKSSFGNVKAFDFKKLKISSSRVVRRRNGLRPLRLRLGGRWQANSLGRP